MVSLLKKYILYYFMVSALFFVYGCSDISDSPHHSYVSDDNIQTVDFIYNNILYNSYTYMYINVV